MLHFHLETMMFGSLVRR